MDGYDDDDGEREKGDLRLSNLIRVVVGLEREDHFGAWFSLSLSSPVAKRGMRQWATKGDLFSFC